MSVLSWVASPRVDGHTRARLEGLDFEDAPARMRNLLGSLRRPVSKGQEAKWRRAGGRRVKLPVAGPCGAGPAPSVAVKVGGTRRHIVSFHAEGHCHASLNIEQGLIDVQLKAPVLWREGYAAAAAGWLAYWSRAVGVDVEGDVLDRSPGDDCSVLRRAGWRMTGVEVCADYQGPGFTRADVAGFMGCKSKATIGERVDTYGHDVKPTIMIGSRASNHSIVTYDKTGQIDDVKGGDRTTYEPTWEDSGNYDPAERVWRVELRAGGRGLTIDDTAGRLELRDPATLARPLGVSRLWSAVTSKKRLIVPGKDERNTRAEVDPRWLSVIGAADLGEDWPSRQARDARPEAVAAAMERARRDMRRAALRIAALTGHVPRDAVELAADLDAAASMAFGSIDGPEASVMAAYAESYRSRCETEYGEGVEPRRRDSGVETVGLSFDQVQYMRELREHWRMSPPDPVGAMSNADDGKTITGAVEG